MVPKYAKRVSQISKPGKNGEKGNNSAHTHPNHTFLTGNSTSRPGEGFGTSPGAQKTSENTQQHVFDFFVVVGPRDLFQSLLQASRFNFPSKMCDLDAYVSSYATFRRFRRFWKVANPFLMIWGSFSLIFRPGKGSFEAKLSSRDQVGC